MKSELIPPVRPYGWGTPEYTSGYEVGMKNARFEIFEARRDARAAGVAWTLIIEILICACMYAGRCFGDARDADRNVLIERNESEVKE